MNPDYIKLKEEKDRVVSEREDLLASCLYQDDIIKKAIHYVEELISDTKGIINDYSYHKDEHQKDIDLLKEDIEHYGYLISILKEGIKYELD
jgi:GH35 family endo-1,4-beta-xylanase